MLRKRIFNNLILYTLLPLLLILITLCIVINERDIRSSRAEVEGRATESANLIDSLLDKYIDRSSLIITNPYLLRNIQIDYSDETEQNYYFSTNITAIIGEPFDGNAKRPFIIYTLNPTLFEGKFLEHLDPDRLSPAMAEALRTTSSRVVWEPALTAKNGRTYITFYRNMLDYRSSVGLLEVNIPYGEIERELDVRGTPNKGLVLARDVNGDRIYLSDGASDAKGKTPEMTDRHYLQAHRVLKSGHQVITAIPKSAIYRRTLRTSGMFFLVFLFGIVVMIFASRTTSRKITENIERFINKLKNNEDVLLQEDLIQIKGNDEIAVIKHKFKDLLGKLNEIYREMVAIRLEKSKADIELLQSRINPHLLYNSLSVMKWNAVWNKDDKTVQLINAMTNYYRQALNRGNDILTIVSELEMIREYVKINTYANSCEYRLFIFVDHEIADCCTLKHLLQPIVENAIVHAFNINDSDPRIIIQGFRQSDTIRLVVTDNGCGMTKETVDRIMDPAYIPDYGGFGIRNLIRRIESYYGSAYGVRIDSSEGKGTKVTVTIAAEWPNPKEDRKM